MLPSFCIYSLAFCCSEGCTFPSSYSCVRMSVRTHSSFTPWPAVVTPGVHSNSHAPGWGGSSLLGHVPIKVLPCFLGQAVPCSATMYIFGTGQSFTARACPGPCGMLTGLSGLHPPDVRLHTPVVTTKMSQTLPEVPWEAKSTPPSPR